jgi:hypothetical protein
MPEFNREYQKYSRNAYNMATFLVKELQLDWVVFWTGMTYFHRFISRHGTDCVHEVTLVVACVFLGSKQEHLRVRIGKLISAAFEVQEHSDDFNSFKRHVLEVEICLCDALGFDFQVIHPFARLIEVAPEGDSDVGRYCHKLSSYLFLSPICVHLTSHEIADGLVYIIARALDVLDTYKCRLSYASAEVTAKVESALLDVLAVNGKRTQIQSIDAALEARRKRKREKGTLP